MDVEQLARVYSSVAMMYVHVANIESMKAANAERMANGHALAYDENAFHQEAVGLAQCAEALRQQGRS